MCETHFYKHTQGSANCDNKAQVTHKIKPVLDQTLQQACVLEVFTEIANYVFIHNTKTQCTIVFISNPCHTWERRENVD